MKHAGEEALDALDPILVKIREMPGLRERKRGAFYRGGSGFLHFHEDPAGFFADLKINGDFERFPINNRKEEAAFFAAAKKALAT